MSEKQPEPFPFPTADDHAPKETKAKAVEQDPSEDAIDQGVEETFPASDPVSVSVTKLEKKDAAK